MSHTVFKNICNYTFVMMNLQVITLILNTISNSQCWASYSKNVIYYSLLVTPFKSNIVTLLVTFWQQ